jgi:archaellum component FlaC
MEELLRQFMDHMNRQMDQMNQRFDKIDNDISDIKYEQAEMRKEVAFYYGSTMKSHEELRSEMRSNFKYLEGVVIQHRSIIDMLKEQQDN